MGDVVAQSIEIDAPIEDVWKLVMDPERLGEWVTIHRSVSEVPEGELRKGSRFRQEMKLKGVPLKVRWEVVECEAPTRARWQGKAAAGAAAGISYDLSESAGGRGSTTRTSSSSPPAGSGSWPVVHSTRSPATGRRSARSHD